MIMIMLWVESMNLLL